MREELVKRIIEAKEKYNRFFSIKRNCQNLIKDIIGYNQFEEYNDNIQAKTACILLGYKPVCLECGGLVSFVVINRNDERSTIVGSWKKYCSISCSTKHTQQKRQNTLFERHGGYGPLSSEESKKKYKSTMLERHGVEHPLKSDLVKEKIKKTCNERYGVDNVAQSEPTKNKMRNTNLSRYGVEYGLSLEETHEKIKVTNIKRYGVEKPLQSPIFQTKFKETCLEKYGTEHFTRSKIYPQIVLESTYRKHLRDGVNREFANLIYEENEFGIKDFLEKVIVKNNFSRRNQLPEFLNYSSQCTNRLVNRLGLDHYFPSQSVSNSETEVFEFVQSLNVNPEQSDRTILEGKELDIFIPSHNLAIEFNGIYWHSINSGKDKNYHLEKTEQCESKGIQLLHIFETEWEDQIKQEIWKSIIKAKLGLFDSDIYARKCSIREITSREARSFLDQNHLQGFANGKTHLGLVYNDILVSVLSYGSSRFKKNETEIIRFASLLNTRVQGGFSKLLSKVKAENIVSFADRRYSSNLNNVYSKTMKLDSISQPSFWVHEDGVLKHRLGYQKHLLQEKLESFDPSKTAMDNLLENNKLVIYDCGNLKYEMK